MKKILLSTLTLVIITLVAGLSLAAVYEITKTPIERAEEKAEQAAYRSVMPQAQVFEPMPFTPIELPVGVTVDEIQVARAEDRSLMGYVVKATSGNGYGGALTVAVGLDSTGGILGVSVISQSETAGLGSKCTEKSFTDKFVGLTGRVEYTKDGEAGKVDALSGATVTTKAVVEAVNAALDQVWQIITQRGEE